MSVRAERRVIEDAEGQCSECLVTGEIQEPRPADDGAAGELFEEDMVQAALV